MDPYDRIPGFLGRSRYVFSLVAPQLYSRGWVDSVPNPLLLRKSGSAGNQTRDLWICRQNLWPVGHRGSHTDYNALTTLTIYTVNLFLCGLFKGSVTISKDAMKNGGAANQDLIEKDVKINGRSQIERNAICPQCLAGATQRLRITCLFEWRIAHIQVGETKPTESTSSVIWSWNYNVNQPGK
jgi:hypothetical protein